MEKLLSHSAKILFGYMCYELYNYNRLKNIEAEMKTAINLDLSFEKVPKELNGKSILVATTLTNLQRENIRLKTVIDDYENRIIAFKFPRNSNKPDLNETALRNVNFAALTDDQELKLEIENNKNYMFFDATNLDATPLKEEKEFNKNNFSNKASLLEKIQVLYLDYVRNCNRISKVTKGLINNQRVLVYGQINHLNDNKFTIKPKYFIGSGLVEFEDIIELTKHKINIRLFNIVLLMVGIGILHFGYTSFFVKKTSNSTN